MEEKNKKDKRIIYLELTDEVEKQLFDYIQEIEALIAEEFIEILGGNAQKALEIVNNYKNKESRDEGEDR